MACAILAILLHVARTGGSSGGVLLRVFDKLGWLREPASWAAELKPVDMFSANDANALLWLSGVAGLFILASVLWSIKAELVDEDSLYVGAGFIVATTAIGLFDRGLMLFVQLLGALLIGALRGWFGGRSRTASSAPAGEP
jgi:hypothetical protein